MNDPTIWQGITIGQIFEWLIWLLGGLAAIIGLSKLVKNGFHQILKSELEPINDKLTQLEKKHDLSDREHAKNYIVRFLADVEQGEPIDQDELHCFWDNYELYKAMGGNSYVHDKVEKLKKAGKL